MQEVIGSIPIGSTNFERHTMSSNPVHEEHGKWYFWNEVWTDREGPFNSEVEAKGMCVYYTKYALDGKSVEKCNRHSDCDLADIKDGRLPGEYKPNFHCHDDECEDCFPK